MIQTPIYGQLYGENDDRPSNLSPNANMGKPTFCRVKIWGQKLSFPKLGVKTEKMVPGS